MVVATNRQGEQTSTTHLERGLYVLHYLSSDAAEPPTVKVRPAEGGVKLILPPSLHDAVLSGPGSAMVLLVEDRASVELTVRPRMPSGSVDAKLRMEPLRDTGFPSNSNASGPTGHFAETDFTLVGHVARRGDVIVQRDQWIAGPDAPSPIEGIEFRWPSDQSGTLRYQVIVKGATQWSDWVSVGRYAGTRGQALPLVGVRVVVSEPTSTDFALRGSALFLGSAPIEQAGTELEFRSIVGHDPLVGLKVDLVKKASARPLVAPSATDMRGGATRKGRVRVFRAGVEQRAD